MLENNERFNVLLSKVFGINKNSINNETSPNNVDSWDSFRTLKMISKLEDEFRIKLDLKEVILIKNVKDIKTLLAIKGVEIDL